MLKISIKSIERILSGATTLGQNSPVSYGNERVLRIPQSSSITRASPSDCFVAYRGYSLSMGEGSYSSADMQSVRF